MESISGSKQNKTGSSERIREMAARLLFMTVHWAKKVRHFSELSHLDQVTLLRENWSKIFIINLAQWGMPEFELAPLVDEAVEKIPNQHLDKVLNNMGKLNEVIYKLVQLQLDRAEFSLLKALALFNPGKSFFYSTSRLNSVHDDKNANLCELRKRQLELTDCSC